MYVIWFILAIPAGRENGVFASQGDGVLSLLITCPRKDALPVVTSYFHQKLWEYDHGAGWLAVLVGCEA